MHLVYSSTRTDGRTYIINVLDGNVKELLCFSNKTGGKILQILQTTFEAHHPHDPNNHSIFMHSLGRIATHRPNYIRNAQ